MGNIRQWLLGKSWRTSTMGWGGVLVGLLALGVVAVEYLTGSGEVDMEVLSIAVLALFSGAQGLVGRDEKVSSQDVGIRPSE